MAEPWWSELREIHDRMYQTDWSKVLAKLNDYFGLEGNHLLRQPCPGVPPGLFLGNVETLVLGKWVLVISLNPQVDDPSHYTEFTDSDKYWAYLRDWFENRMYGFFAPLARLGAASLGIDAEGRERTFVAERMVFTELVPYSSVKFALKWQTVAELSGRDPAVIAASEFNDVLIREGQPAITLVNGNSAVWIFDREFGGKVNWKKSVRFHSPDGRRMLRCEPGAYVSDGKFRLIAGLPFVRSQNGYRSNAEVETLGRQLRRLVETGGN